MGQEFKCGKTMHFYIFPPLLLILKRNSKKHRNNAPFQSEKQLVGLILVMSLWLKSLT